MKEHVPGRALLSPIALAALALVVTNDLWLKRAHPGIVSGKLSDVGLCVFLPVFLAAVAEWGALALRLAAPAPRPLHAAAIALTGAYFAAIKVAPWATHAHVSWLSLLFPRRHFAAVTDPSDLVCLPALALAYLALALLPTRPSSRPSPSRPLPSRP